MKKKLLAITVILLGLALTASAQQGACGNACRHDGPGMGHGKMACGGGAGCGKMAGGPGMMGHRGMGDGPGMERILAMADKLELTDAQRTKLKQLHETFQLERIDRRAGLQKAEVKLRGLMRDNKASTAEINKSIDDVSALKAEMAKMRVRHHAEMKGVLTEKQQEMLQDLRPGMGMRMHGMIDQDDDMDEPEEPAAPQPGR